MRREFGRARARAAANINKSFKKIIKLIKNYHFGVYKYDLDRILILLQIKPNPPRGGDGKLRVSSLIE
jgi:hypothetical protein